MHSLPGNFLDSHFGDLPAGQIIFSWTCEDICSGNDGLDPELRWGRSLHGPLSLTTQKPGLVQCSWKQLTAQVEMFGLEPRSVTFPYYSVLSCAPLARLCSSPRLLPVSSPSGA